ncbi:hypothetical protein [Azorhizobium doebereinerae]|uniref:hypothetical protein n=1 Tax=Azorhizobium doebereinerae TaxID=281091 RepID=UPI00042462F5|nr:hypothetical protein [Azorhizobium doebereinerae]
MTPVDHLLAALAEAASAAGAREDAFRTEAATTARRLEAERAAAYRRLAFMRALSEAVAGAQTPEAAVAAVHAQVRAGFGWDGESEARTQVLERIAPLALALHAQAHPAPQEDTTAPPDAPADPLAALTDFEAWYEQTRASSFWYLFEHYMPETPRVDF